MGSEMERSLEETVAVFEQRTQRGEPLTTREVAETLECTRRTAYNRLERLVERGRIETKKVGARGRVWWKPSSPEPDANQSEPTMPSLDSVKSGRQEQMAGPPPTDRDRRDRDDHPTENEGVENDVRLEPLEESVRSFHVLAEELLDANGKPQVSEGVLRMTTELLDVPDVILFRYDENDDVLYPAAQSLKSAGCEREVRAVHQEVSSDVGRAYAEKTTRRIEDVGRSLFVNTGGERESSYGLATPVGEHGVLVCCTRTERRIDHRTERIIQLVGTIAEAAYDRIDRKLEFGYHREKLAVLNDVNVVLRDIHDAIVEQSTREEIEATVCERLARSYWYTFAWIGSVDPTTHAITPRVEIGVDGYLETIPLSTDPDVPAGRGPVGRAVRTMEAQVVRNVADDPSFEIWREYAKEYNYSAAAAIPIVHRDTVYGVLGIYTARENAFGEDERDAISHLGETIGFAIASVERKRALMSDELVELEIHVPDAYEFTSEATVDRVIRFTHAVPTGDGEYLLFGTVPDGGKETLEMIAERSDEAKAVQVFERSVGDDRFELTVSDPHVVSVLADHGIDIVEATITAGDLGVTCRLPTSVNPRHVIGAIEALYPRAELTARRHVTREAPGAVMSRTLTEDLTERQSAILEASYLAGFFDWPRSSSGEEIADSLGISPATFHEHLRGALRKILADIVT
ncbi:MAG: bacterio-opsin activator domain-containing protein [Halodesulfurarchaeum sp.]